MTRKSALAAVPASSEIPLTPNTWIAAVWAGCWMAGFHPEGLARPWSRRATQAGTRVEWTDAEGRVRAGALLGDEAAYGPELNPFQMVSRDYDGLHELVPASRVFLEGRLKVASCDTCEGCPPVGFICGTCGEAGRP